MALNASHSQARLLSSSSRAPKPTKSLQSVPVFLPKYTGKLKNLKFSRKTNETLPLQNKLTLGRILGGMIM